MRCVRVESTPCHRHRCGSRPHGFSSTVDVFVFLHVCSPLACRVRGMHPCNPLHFACMLPKVQLEYGTCDLVPHVNDHNNIIRLGVISRPRVARASRGTYVIISRPYRTATGINHCHSDTSMCRIIPQSRSGVRRSRHGTADFFADNKSEEGVTFERACSPMKVCNSRPIHT